MDDMPYWKNGVNEFVTRKLTFGVVAVLIVTHVQNYQQFPSCILKYLSFWKRIHALQLRHV